MLEGGAFATDVGVAAPVDAVIRMAALCSAPSIAANAAQIAACMTAARLREWLEGYARQLGFAGACYVHLGHALGDRGDTQRARPIRFLSTDQGEGDGISANGWLVRNPAAARIGAAFAPFAWPAPPESGSRHVQTGQSSEGICGDETGIVIPVQDYFAGPAYLVLSGIDAVSAGYFAREWAPEISFIAGHFHVQAIKLIAPREDAPSSMVLTSRQIDCLRLAALGHTAAESGDVLGLSFRGVEFHLHKIVAKFGTRTKLTAVVCAVGSGLIDL